jgi:flagellar hook assembly protein FlgD
MKKVFLALMLLLCAILMFQLPTNAEGLLQETYGKVEDDPIVKELLQKLEKNETISNPRFKVKHTVLDEKENKVKELDLNTKYAVTTKKKVQEDGTTRDEVYMLAATDLSDTNSRTAEGVTQYNLLNWSESGSFVKITRSEGVP